MYGYLSLRWRHNDYAGVSNHQPHGCLLNRLFRRKSKKTSKLRVTGLCAGNSPGTGEFPAQMASYAENVSIWWRHHVVNFATETHVPYPCQPTSISGKKNKMKNKMNPLARFLYSQYAVHILLKLTGPLNAVEFYEKHLYRFATTHYFME